MSAAQSGSRKNEESILSKTVPYTPLWAMWNEMHGAMMMDGCELVQLVYREWQRYRDTYYYQDCKLNYSKLDWFL